MENNVSSLDTNNRVERLIEEVASLPPEQKDQLLSALLEESGPSRFSMILGNGHISKADVVIQVNSLGSEMLASIVAAITARIEKS